MRARTQPAPARPVRRAGASSPPLEHRILVTVTMCLLAFGAVMVYSASSPEEAVSGQGYGTGEFMMFVIASAIGLVVMRVLERRGLALLTEQRARWFLLGSVALLIAVLLPGIGKSVNGARRWIDFGPVQFQPSELVKFAIILYLAGYLANHPRRLRDPLPRAIAPVALAAGPALLLIYMEPDLGTSIVLAAVVLSMLLIAGMPLRYIGTIIVIGVSVIAIVVAVSPYERVRFLSFLHPWAKSCVSSNCYQGDQGQIAVGSGGLFGRGLGNSIQKIYSLPEAQSDYILGVVGEEVGFVGVFAVIVFYGMIAFAGLRTARKAANVHHKLLAAGVTSLVLCQAMLNIAVVLGVAPLTGVPLPFISYAPTSVIVMLASIGLLLGIARPAARTLRLVDERPRRGADPETQRKQERERRESLDRDRRDRRARRARARGSGRLAG